MAKVAVMVEMDYCVGCWACQSACSNNNKLPVGQTYLRLIKNQAEEVDGELRLYSFPYPLDLEKCGVCVQHKSPPTCVSICMSNALAIGDVDSILEKAKKINGKTAIYL